MTRLIEEFACVVFLDIRSLWPGLAIQQNHLAVSVFDFLTQKKTLYAALFFVATFLYEGLMIEFTMPIVVMVSIVKT